MPRKRRHSSEEEDEEAEDVENNVRTKRRAAVEARDRVAAKEGASDEEEEEEDFEEEDDDKDEDYEGEAPDEDEGEEEADDDDDEEEENEAGEKDEGDEEDEEVDEEEPETVLCILADLEEPTEGIGLVSLSNGPAKKESTNGYEHVGMQKDTPGYVLKKKDSPKKLELCFMGDMRETLVDVSEAFSKHFEEEKLPVLHITKFDMIGETEGTTQIDVLEVKYDKSYDARQLDDPKEDILSQDFYSVVRVDGIDGTWASQYFLPED